MSASDKSPWPPWGGPPRTAALTTTGVEQQELLHWGKSNGRCGSQGVAEAADGSSSIQHGVQLVSQGIEHGANVIQNVLGRSAGGALSLLSANALLCCPQCGCQG